MKHISIGSWTFLFGPFEDKPVPWPEMLRKLSALGYDGVEIGGFSIHPTPESHPQKEDRDRLRQEAANLGLGFSGLAANLLSEKLLNTEDHASYFRAFRAALQFAADLGVKALCMDTVQSPEELDAMDYGTARDRLVRVWKRCAQEAAERGCYMTWEFEPRFAFNKPSQILEIVDAIDEDNFGIEFDTSHAEIIARLGAGQTGKKEILPGGCLEFARKLRGKINHVHLMDCDGTLHPEGVISHVPFGEGVLDFEAILPELLAHARPHEWWTIDLAATPDAWNLADACRTYLDAMRQQYCEDGSPLAASAAPAQG